MATYTIIGGDGKQYSSVLGEDLHRWIAEGRLNAQSQAKAEGDAEFRPLSTFPEFADAFPLPPEVPGAPPVFSPASVAEGDYELDIGGCISRGWNLYKENFGVLFVASLILWLVTAGAPYLVMLPVNTVLMHSPIALRLGFTFLLPAVTRLIVGPLAGGVCMVYLLKIRQQTAGVSDIFAGFQKAFAQLYLGALAIGLIAAVCMLPFNFVFQSKAGPVLEQLQDAKAQHLASADVQNLSHDLLHAFAGALPILLICLIPMTYLMVCWQFATPLIIDKEMKFWPAMKTSFRMVNKHWWQVFGLTVVVGLVSLAGILGCCIGILFTAPIGIAAMMYAYETIFSRPQTG